MKKIFGVSMVLLVLILALSVGTVQAQAKSKVYTWKCSTYGTPSDWEFLGFKYFSDRVKEMSDGRMNVKLYPVNELYPPTDSVGGTSRGLSELAITGGFYLDGIHRAFGLHNNLTGGPISSYGEAMMVAQNPAFQKISAKLYGPKIQHVGYVINPTMPILSKKPIHKAEDFKGLIVRSSAPRDRMFKKLGAKATYIATPEIYTALQLGTIDVVDKGNYSGVYGLRLHEVTKYIIEPPFQTPAGIIDIIATKKRWDSLPPDLQTILKQAAITAGLHYWAEGTRQGFEARKKMIEYGLKVINLPPEEMAKIHKAARELWKEFSNETPESAELVRIYMETCKQLGYSMD